MYTHRGGDNHQNRYKSTSSAYAFHFRYRLGHYNKSHLAMTSGSGDITCMAYGKDSRYSTSAYHVPPAGSFSPARARILGHACSTDSGQSGEDVFASLDGRHTWIPYPTVVSLRNCGTPLLGPTHSTCAPPTCTLNIDFERPTMSLQVYKESRPFDFCSLSYSSAQVQK